MRSLLLIFLLSQLSACDPGGQPEQVTGKRSEVAEQGGSVQPGAKSAQKAAPPPAPLPAVQPVQPSPPAVPEKKPSPAPKGGKSKEMLVRSAPEIELILKLPEDLSGRWEAKGKSALVKPLLPPLFQEPKESSSPFQLSGKLITGKDGDDYWDSIDGAELNFEFKQ